MTTAPRLRLTDVAFHERAIKLRMPFKFGIISLTESQQVVVEAEVTFEDGRTQTGLAAEMLLPKWFDKNPDLSHEDNAEQLRLALRLTADLYRAEAQPLTAFGLHAKVAPELLKAGARHDLNPLVVNFGSALLDRAIIDALGKATGLGLGRMLAQNLPGIDATTTPDLEGFDIDGALATFTLPNTINARHTIGMLDAIDDNDEIDFAKPDDGLPVTLKDCIDTYGLRYFKMKLGGDAEFDLDRIHKVARTLHDTLGQDYLLTLDGNEQFKSAQPIAAFVEKLSQTPALKEFYDRILFIEQPIARAVALSEDVGALARLKPVLVDESDGEMGVFATAKGLGYTGVSSKSCKGLYRAVLNRLRCMAWNAEAGEDRYFVSAEDLTIQPGLSLQEDLVLAAVIGCDHIERNGHHYVRGKYGSSPREVAHQLEKHPALYRPLDDTYALRIENGVIDISSLSGPGLGAGDELELEGTTPT